MCRSRRANRLSVLSMGHRRAVDPSPGKSYANRSGRSARPQETFVSEIERGLRRVDVLEIVLISRGLDANPSEPFAERSAEAGLKAHRPKRARKIDGN